jgi:hypothetical protein
VEIEKCLVFFQNKRFDIFLKTLLPLLLHNTKIIMKISVENLGTIKKGEISLDKDLTIFTGENNSGKSYMSYLCYGFFDGLIALMSDLGLAKDFANEANNSNYWIRYKNGIGIKIEDFYEIYTKILSKRINNEVLNLTLGREVVIREKTVMNINIDKNSNYKNNIDFKHIGTLHEFTLGTVFYTPVIENNIVGILRLNDVYDGSYDDIMKEKFFTHIQQYLIYNEFVSYTLLKNYFVPAERTAINMFYNDIVKQRALEGEELRSANNMVETFNKMQQQGKLLPRSPLPITNYIYFAYDFRNHVLKPPTEFADLATELENLLGGGVGVSGFGDLQFQPTKQENQIPLYLSSSLVKSWSGVVIYLRHLAQKNDILMIDEPEINLHPKSQVLIARFLAKMVNRGIKIVVSTHSDYILRELSTLIILNNEFEGKEKLLNRYPEYQNQGLAAEKVAVYNFANHTIENVEITAQGIEIESINKVIQSQTEISDAFYYTYLNSLETETAE